MSDQEATFPDPYGGSRANETAEFRLNRLQAGIEGKIRSVRNSREPEPSVDRVVQYTALGTLAAMFPPAMGLLNRGSPKGPKEIWASAAPHMNDRREFAYGQERILDALREDARFAGHQKEARNFLAQIAEASVGENVYCACFTAKSDDLGQWRGYGDDGQGCNLIYDLDDLRRAHSWLSGWVVYDLQAQKMVARAIADHFLYAVRTFMPSETGLPYPPEALRILARLLPSTFVFFKHPAFAEEREFRLVYAPLSDTNDLPVFFAERKGRVVPFVKLPFEEGAPLQEITLGPRTEPDRTLRAIRHMIQERSLQVTVKPSDIPYLP